MRDALAHIDDLLAELQIRRALRPLPGHDLVQVAQLHRPAPIRILPSVTDGPEQVVRSAGLELGGAR